MYENFAPYLAIDQRKKLASRAVEKYRGDVSRRSSRMRRIRDIYRHFTLEPRPKSFPFSHAANVQMPLMTAPVIQHQSRLFDMILSTGGRIATVVSPTYYSPAERDIAERFFNHYILHEMPEFSMGLDASLFQAVLVGSSFRRTIWDETLARCRSEWIPIEDFVAPPGIPSKDPSMRDLPRYSVVTRKTLRQLRANVAYIDADTIKPDQGTSDDHERLGERSDRAEYNTEDADIDTPRIVIEYYFNYLAPRRKKKADVLDGKEHPAYACIDLQSETLLSLCYREEDDPDDLERFADEFGTYQKTTRMYSRLKEAYDAGALPDEPKKPDLEEPMQRKREVPLCTHYSAYPSEGFYGLGLGDFLLGQNKAINTMVNQALDHETVRIARPGFISRQLRGPRGGIASQPGQLIEVDAPMGAIKDGIHYPDIPPADPFFINLANMIIDMAQNVTGAYSTMSGQIPGSNQSATAVTALIEQANMPITVMAKRVKESFRHELEKIWRTLGTWLPDQKMVDVIGPDARVSNVPVSATMFGPDSRLFPVADPRLRGERIADAQNKLGSALQNPFIMNALQSGHPAALELIGDLSAAVYRVMGDERAAMAVEAMKQPPPQPPGPPPGGPPQAGPPPGPPPPGPPQGPPPGPPQPPPAGA